MNLVGFTSYDLAWRDQMIRELKAERDDLLSANKLLRGLNSNLEIERAKLHGALREIVEYDRGDVASPEGEIARRVLGVSE